MNLFLGQDDVENLYQPVGDCNRDVGLTFEFGQQTIRIPKDLFWAKGKKDGKGRCLAMIVAPGDGFPDSWWLMGKFDPITLM